ncbi:hypothetical protein QBC43DRAFT_143406 [Cladorrhinum sp. PSN259]|nr:hypothetical protein QBC43DRAFT_143406 [Cladorrhinum sp. PSN259]
MDGLSALGVASNVLQLVTFASQLVVSASSIYRSPTGASENNIALSDVASDLSRLIDRIVVSDGCSPELKQLSLRAKDVTQQILDILNTLIATSKKTRWKSFLVAAREVCKGDKLTALTDNLSRLQIQISLHLQAHVRTAITELVNDVKALEITAERLDAKKTFELEKLRGDILGAVHSLSLDVSAKRPSQSRNPIPTSTIQQALDQLMLDDLDHLSTGALRSFHTSVSTLSTHVADLRNHQKILTHLYFDSLTAREDKVSSAHARTFEWVFRDAHPDGGSRIGFADWLANRDGIFWIQGKAGSGKSTLLKYLSSHPMTATHLQHWARPKQLVLAKFYFWNSGTKLQKSQEGLFRSLLFEILRQCPELLPVVWQNLCKSTRRGATLSKQFTPPGIGLPLSTRDPFDLDIPWDIDELKQLLEELITLEKSKNFCFIIDGLDEYQTEGHHDHRDLIQTIKRLAACPGMKFCLSSRPWTVFLDAFGGPQSSQVLRLEDLTREDIRKYVSDNLSAHDQYHKLSRIDAGYCLLIDEVVRRAQGVFLWVFLVVRELLEGLTYNDTIKTMRRRLEGFPESLDEFFRHMLNSVPKFYQIQTTRALQVATSVDYPLPLMTYSFLNDVEDDPQVADREERRPCDKYEIAQRYDTMRRRLDSWCKGLLEATGWRHDEEAFLSCRVDFLHRTVRDFLVSEGVKGVTDTPQEDRCETWVLLCQAIVLLFKRAPGDIFPPTSAASSAAGINDDTHACLDQLCHFAKNAISDGADEDLVHDILVKAMNAASAVESLASMRMREEILGAACHNGLSSFVQGQLFLTRTWNHRQLDLPQLTAVLRRALTCGSISGIMHWDIINNILEYVSRLGYHQDQVFGSVFQEFVHRIDNGNVSATQAGVLESVGVMIRNGFPVDVVWIQKHFPRHVNFLMSAVPASKKRDREEEHEFAAEMQDSAKRSRHQQQTPERTTPSPSRRSRLLHMPRRKSFTL